MIETKKVIVVMPAYNAEATLEQTIADIPFKCVDELLLVDDASKDNTVALAKRIAERHPALMLSTLSGEQGRIPFNVISLEQNRGYGGNQKNCYAAALARGADIVVMLHPDYQYDPKLITYFVGFIRDGYFDVMLGSRIRSRQEALNGGMPLYKYYANRLLTLIENIASGRNLSEWHTGMRAYTKAVLENVDFESFSDDFIFDTQMLFAVIARGYAIGDIPVPVRYFAEASSINFKRSARYGMLTLFETGKFVAKRLGRVMRYICAGVAAVLTNLSVYVLLLKLSGLHYVSAALLGFFAGALVSFTLHKYWTFKECTLKNIHYQLGVYVALITLNAGINAGLLAGLVYVHFSPLAANIISNALVALWSFFAFKHLAFAHKTT